jgi:hypothetical protein
MHFTFSSSAVTVIVTGPQAEVHAAFTTPRPPLHLVCLASGTVPDGARRARRGGTADELEI